MIPMMQKAGPELPPALAARREAARKKRAEASRHDTDDSEDEMGPQMPTIEDEAVRPCSVNGTV